nr:DUF2799 domain-containing protein [Acinetobacter sp. Marseille-Q1620]
MKSLSLVGSVLLLSGCAAMSVEECKTTNWFVKGEDDGSRGHLSKIAGYYKACQKVNVLPDQTEYEHGYRLGLEIFCQAQNIFYEALNGGGNYQVCPSQYRAGLRPYYDAAHNYYQAEKDYRNSLDEFERLQDYSDEKKLKETDKEDYKKRYAELKNKTRKKEWEYRKAQIELEQFKFRNGLN